MRRDWGIERFDAHLEMRWLLQKRDALVPSHST
jgi:hypothetical protein